MTEERHPSRNGEQEPEDVKLARRVIKDYAEANAGKRILRPGRTVELDLAEAVVRHYEASERAIDKTMQDLLNAPDEVVQAALRLEGHDPNDVATIAKQAGQIAALRVDIAARSESVPPSFASWLSGRIAWLKAEILAGGDYEHLNTRRKEAITIADKFGVKWEDK